MPPTRAVLDANVLFPRSLRDTLLRCAEAGLYELFWTDYILEEMRRNLVAKSNVLEDKARNLVTVMKAAFPQAFVPITAYHNLIATMHNDPKDRHVLAAAVACGAQTIVTFNLKDW